MASEKFDKKEEMSGFKLLALRTGSKQTSPSTFLKSKSSSVAVDWLKVLKENTIYPFCSNYEYPNNDFKTVSIIKEGFDLFSVELSNGNKLPINIHAIVGENGTGKSTLVEIIYWMNYNLGTINNHLKTDENEAYVINRGFNAELFYLADNKHFKLVFWKGTIQQYEMNFVDGNYKELEEQDYVKIREFKDLSDFFYTVVINYSQHSLNALEIGDWIDPLFHKNDAYQTPIVINPQRHNGNIDINKERQLLSRRLQANILEQYTGKTEDSLRNLANGKIAEKLEIEYYQDYFERDKRDKKTLTKLSVKIFRSIAKELENLFGLDFSNDDLEVLFSTPIHFKSGVDNYTDHEKVFKRVFLTYIFLKLNKLVRQYVDYSIYRNSFSNQIHEILKKVRHSDSHLVFKIKGAILHLKYFKKIYPLIEWRNFSDTFQIDIEKYSDVIHEEIIPAESDYYINTFMMAMPSFWSVEIIPTERNLISQFSSGEKQRIFSISSIVYHIINLNSVEENKRIKEYKYINLILDEIELYYHPEWQRKFISDLISYIRKIDPQNLKNIEGLNILFVTHSPFILSDIPSNNILKLILDNSLRSSVNYQENQTFAANIHDLLANDFFLENGFMGEFAKNRINEVVDFLRMKKWEYDEKNINERIDAETIDDVKENLRIQLDIIKLQKKLVKNLNESLNLDKCQEIIDLVGEPVLRESLSQLLSEVKEINSEKI